MALHVTQCPRCESTFNTSARMLQAAHGLVRCGACLSIFEADRHLVDLHSRASNDERDQEESVFISAPEDYFNPARFLKQGQGDGSDADEDDQDDILYAQSDVKDSNFDVFDTDLNDQDSALKEQITDSNFDVFDAGDIHDDRPNPHQKVQDHQFDIYNAGERELRDPEPDLPPLEADDGRFQLKASYSFADGSAPAGFSLSSLLSSLWPGTSDSAGSRRREQRRDPSISDQDSEVILPAGPDAETLLEGLAQAGDTEVILPAGPDAATMIAARKAANAAALQAASNQIEPDQNDELLYDEEDFEPAENRFLDAESIDPADVLNEIPLTEVHATDDQFGDALDGELDWDEAEDIDLDDKSFVILPVDPYQPSAFRSTTDTMPDKSEPTSRESKAPRAERSFALGGPGSRTDDPHSAAATSRRDAATRRSGAGTEAGSERRRAERAAGRSAGRKGDSNGRGAPATAGPKDAGSDKQSARRLASELADQDESREILSEENLRAIRDVDTSLEIENRNRNSSRRRARILLGTAACLLAVVVFVGQLLWQRMPVLSQDVRLRPWYQTACNLLRCQLPPYVNPAQILTDNLVVRSHPETPDTLELNAVFRNRADFPQPFPLIELRFSDLNNSTVASRQLLPDEYLPQALRGMPLMPPGAPVQITLELADPGPQAVNYQLDFKAAPPRPGS